MTLQNYRILIADDNSTFAKTLALLIENILGEKASVIDFASNGKEAVDLAFADTPYNIIFMDVNMPLMNGVEATKIINKTFYRATRIVAISFQKDMNSVTQMISAGAENFIHKENVTLESIEKLFDVTVL